MYAEVEAERGTQPPPGDQQDAATVARRVEAAAQFWAYKFWYGVAGYYTCTDLVQQRPIGEDFVMRQADCYFVFRNSPTIAPCVSLDCGCQNNGRFQGVVDNVYKPRDQIGHIVWGFFDGRIAKIIGGFNTERTASHHPGDGSNSLFKGVKLGILHFGFLLSLPPLSLELDVLRWTLDGNVVGPERAKLLEEMKTEA